MIEFLIEHTTREPKPQHFAAGARISRGDDTEAFFVRLGVAAFVDGDALIDADGRPLDAVVATDTASLLVGLDTPQRASTGPGNALLFGGDQQNAAALAQLRETLAESDATLAQLRDEYGQKQDADAAHIAALEAELDALKAALPSVEAGTAPPLTADTGTGDAPPAKPAKAAK